MTPATALDKTLPTSVRYVKNGEGGCWWKEARANHQVHLGWKRIDRELLLKPDFVRIERLVRDHWGPIPGATQDFNQLRDLLDGPSKHIWITFEDGYLWWCTVRDGAVVNPDGESPRAGNFWLLCNRHWSNYSLGGELLAIPNLPGTVTKVAGFRGTVCQPRSWQAVLRLIRDEKDPDALLAAQARREYELAVVNVVRRLSPKDFEQLIDLILTRTGWARISTLGKAREGVDLEAQNMTADEIAFVQVKSSAEQHQLDDYVERFRKRREFYARMIFAVHSPRGTLTPPSGLPEVQVWTGPHVAKLVVQLGLGEWVEKRLA